MASGAGTTFRALVGAARGGKLPANVMLLIASRRDVPAIDLALQLGIGVAVLDERAIGREACDTEMESLLLDRGVELVVLAGYLRKIGPRTLRTFAGRIINTHPAPLPPVRWRGYVWRASPPSRAGRRGE